VTLRVVCFFRRKKMGTWRGASLFLRGHPPQSLPGVYRFLPPTYSRAPALHIASNRTPSLWRCHTSVGGCVSYYVQPQVDKTEMCGLSLSGCA